MAVVLDTAMLMLWYILDRVKELSFSPCGCLWVIAVLLMAFQFFVFFQGPLFQQRPYPSPGAVLRRNAELAGHQGKPAGPNYAPIHKRGDGSDGLGDAD